MNQIERIIGIFCIAAILVASVGLVVAMWQILNSKPQMTWQKYGAISQEELDRRKSLWAERAKANKEYVFDSGDDYTWPDDGHLAYPSVTTTPIAIDLGHWIYGPGDTVYNHEEVLRREIFRLSEELERCRTKQ